MTEEKKGITRVTGTKLFEYLYGKRICRRRRRKAKKVVLPPSPLPDTSRSSSGDGVGGKTMGTPATRGLGGPATVKP